MLSFQRLLSTEKNREEFDTESDADKHSENELHQETDQACDEPLCGSQSLDTSADVMDDMEDDEDAEEGEILEDGELVEDDEAQKADADTKNAAADDDEKQKKDEKGDKKRERRPSMTSKMKEIDKKRRKRRRRDSDEEENDSDNLKTKRRARDDRRSPLRATSPESGSEGSESNDDESDFSLNEEVMLQVFKQMMDKMKKDSGENRKKSKAEKMMEKMMRNQSNIGTREVREMFLRNKRLFRGNLERDRTERGAARAPRDRERRLALRQNDRRGVRDRDRDRERVRDRETTPRDRDRERVRDRDKDRERPRVEQSPKTNTCKFFLEGKCHRGSECPFPHDAPQQKKKDICKFYLQGYCGKGDHCLFMHGEFPCKFFHTGAECYSGDNCRFSHQPLTDETRSILKVYLDSGELPDEQQSQAAGTNSSSSFPYQPVKPVQKRHAVLGDVTEEMKNSYWTWIWQQEMKEMELAYTGNKRNLFCIEKPFVMSEKPSSPEPIHEADYDEREQTKVMSFYIDTMADVNSTNPTIPEVNEDDKLLELSYHDEDLRLPLVVPTSTAPLTNVMEGANNSHAIIKNEIMEPEDLPCEQSVQNFATNPPPVIPEESLPKTARDLFERIRNKNNQKHGEDSEGDTTGDLIISSQDSDLREKEVKDEKKWIDESEEDEEDDDTEDQPLKAALKKLQNQQQQQPKEESSKQQPKIDIAKMLSVIRQTTTQMSGAPAPQTPVKQADFWQTIFSGCSNVQSSTIQSESRDPRLAATPPQNEPRDPRLKRSKAEGKTVSEVSSPPTSSSESLPKIDIKNLECEFKLLPVTVNDIDYSCYVALYRSDAKLKNDPRLQKFFSKLPNSVIDHLSKILPPPAHQPSASSTSTSQTVTISSPTKRLKRDSVSPPSILPPLPPLTLTQPKSTVISSIVPPPPPLMSPFELTTSKPSFAVPNPVVKQENSQEEEKIEQKPQIIQLPSPLLSSSTSDSKPMAVHLPQGLTSLVSLVTSKSTASDLRKNLIIKKTVASEQPVTSLPTDSNNDDDEQNLEIADRPLSPTEECLSVASPSSEVLTIAEDTPLSPSSRRSSSEIGSPPLQSTMATPLSPPKDESLVIAEPSDETQESIKDVFKTIDPTASPFC